MATGDQSGTWGTTTNTNLELIGQALGWGTRAIANASTDNITIADGASDSDRSMALKLTGGGQACTVTILPNTSSKVWVMENATAATLTFTAGSGANVAILAGETKMIATDGLGSGGVVYDVLTDLNLAGTTKTAALTNAGLINTATLTTTSNLIVGGNASLTGGSYFAAESYRYTDGTSALTIGSGGLVTAVSGITSTASANTFGASSFNDANITNVGSIALDTIINDGTDITLDSGGDIVLDAAGDDILLKSAGTHEGNINLASSNLTFKSIVSDKDMIFQGNDGGSAITALTLDMSAAGAATFNNDVTAFSDERLKSNITTIPDALSKVTEMRGVHYVRDATGKDSSGVIAQELQKIAPELVLTAEDEMGTLSVNYGNITGYLIEAVKELSARVKELEGK